MPSQQHCGGISYDLMAVWRFSDVPSIIFRPHRVYHHYNAAATGISSVFSEQYILVWLEEEVDEAGPHAGHIDTDSHFKYIVHRRAQQGFTVYQSEPIGSPFDLTDGKVDQEDIEGFRTADRYYQAIADEGTMEDKSAISGAGVSAFASDEVADRTGHDIFKPAAGAACSFARARDRMVLYFYSNSTATGSISGFKPGEKHSVAWFNPRTGEKPLAQCLAASPEGVMTLPLKPDCADWVLSITK